jgi:erythromycin esterase-like protein
MATVTEAERIDIVRDAAYPITDAPDVYDPLLDLVGDARFTLLGEASHGTHEFYRERIAITKRLIREKGVTAVAVEADWPDAYRVNRYVRGLSDDPDADAATSGFQRFPQWMWRNTQVLAFVEWLRVHNRAQPPDAPRVGFYGLDLYSLHKSMEAVLRYVEKAQPEAAELIRERYACFDHFGPDPQFYGLVTSTGLSAPCEQGVVDVFTELSRLASERAGRMDPQNAEDLFDAEQNARVVKDAETYYRTMFLSNVSSWNVRDRHMADTLETLTKHLQRQEGRGRIAVWAHNSHLGDARATEMGERGELNLGQLVRERFGDDSALIGFTTDHGTVTAASDWEGPAERKIVRPALPGSYESTFHETNVPRFMLTWPRGSRVVDALSERRLERAIGVIYRPRTERVSHYFHAELCNQFDAVLHFDETTAVEPLERTAKWEAGELPETYPFAV